MIVYKTTNLINGKIYIGLDTYNNPNYIGSGKTIKKAIKKYGKENFRKDILEYCSSLEQLNEREIYWIACFNSTNNKIGYNIVKGGGGILGFKHTNNAKEKIVKALIGRKCSEETRKKIGAANKIKMTGKKMPEETKQKLSIAHKGLNTWNKGRKHSEETKAKMREIHKGKAYSKGYKFTAEQKKKLSDRNKKMGIKPPYREHFLHSEETKQKIREKLIGNKNRSKKEVLI
jgi:group I intron endonuclease